MNIETNAATLKNLSKIHLPELDLLRGFAALFMVFNHMIASLLSSPVTDSNPYIYTTFFITSFAPVLFFFASGIGSGIQSVTKSNQLQLRSTLYKFALLMIADAFFAWGKGNLWGFDFLGFIAVIVILIELIRCSQFPKTLCVTGILLIFVVRFIIGPKLSLEDQVIANWLVGFDSIEGSSYPFSPWFTYPLLGFLLGSFIAEHFETAFIKKLRNNALLLVIGSLFLIVSYLLLTRGYVFFRWQTMSFGYYCISFAIISLTLLTVYNLHRVLKQKHLKLLYIGGVASLAFVPIHYYLIHLSEMLSPMFSNIYTNIWLLPPILFVSFVLSSAFGRMMKKVQTFTDHPYLLPSIWLIIMSLGFSTYQLSSRMPHIAAATQALGILFICVLFSLRTKKKQ